MTSVIATKQLPYPSGSFENVHCSRCVCLGVLFWIWSNLQVLTQLSIPYFFHMISLRLHFFSAPSFKPCSSLITLGVNPIYSSSGQVAPSSVREGQALLPSEEDLTEGHISPSRLEEETRRGNACCKVPMGIPTFQHTCYLTF